MPSLMSRIRRGQKQEAETVTRADRVRAAVRIAMVAFLALRLARAVRRLPKDVALLRKPATTATPA